MLNAEILSVSLAQQYDENVWIRGSISALKMYECTAPTFLWMCIALLICVPSQDSNKQTNKQTWASVTLSQLFYHNCAVQTALQSFQLHPCNIKYIYIYI